MLLLCIATWRGPIPMVHAHAAASGSNVKLGRHLQSYHQGELRQTYFTWHLHFLLPWDRFEPSDTESDCPPLRDPLTNEGVVVSAPATGELITHLSDAQLQASFCGQQVWPSVWSRELATLGMHSPAFHSFAESLLQAAPLCAVIGVALC